MQLYLQLVFENYFIRVHYDWSSILKADAEEQIKIEH